MENNYLPLVCTHLHSSGSFLDGCGKLERYVELAKEYNHPAIALTDHGNALMLFNFWKAAKEAGVKPILGCEFYITTDIEIKEPSKRREVVDRDKHIIILIKNDVGYKNFCHLNYLSFSDGFYYKPRITYDQLFEHKEGLIITTACAAGQVNQLFDKGKKEEAEAWFLKFKEEFGEDFYTEIQFNELNDKEKFGMNQKDINDFMIELAKKHNVKTIIGADTHYADKEDTKLQDILINCMMRKTDAEQVESFFNAKHLYFHNSNDYFEFNKEFGFNYDEELIKECFTNSLEIADKCNYDFKTGGTNFPIFPLPEGYKETNKEFCTELAYKGLFKKLKERVELGENFGDELIEEYEKRLDYEIEVISNKGYIDYFLIVQDLVKWAKSNKIFVGAGRGSCAGSLLAYSLNIAEIDPIKFSLYFERFLNPERTAFPDIDLDFQQDARHLIREYLENKYGKEAVFGVGSHHLYHPKSALQDVTRGLGLDSSFGSTLMMEVSKLEELEDQKNLREYFDTILLESGISPTLAKWIMESEEVIKWADKLLGQCKNIGTHAGGILICPGPIYDYIPVIKSAKEIVTAFREADGSGKDLSELGLLKLDVLGLKTLNVINDCIESIKRDLNEDITDKIRYVDLEDVNLFTRFKKGNNVGIFQMDGPTQSRLIKSINPDTFDDIVAISAINRPGPLEAFSEVFGKWKRWEKEHNDEELLAIEEERYPFEFMREPLKKTYGCLLFQEQFMLMVVAAAGFTMGEADSFRRAIAWHEDHPKYHTVKKYFDKLGEGMREKGYSSLDVDKFIEYCRAFMGYSFNLSHSVSYSYISMQCLFLKTYYPAYFYANLLNYEDQEEYQSIIASAVADGLEILNISINKSEYKFKVEDGNKIRIGFKALKGFGDKANEELVSFNIAQYDSISDILALPFKKVNSGSMQCLIDVGAFDEFGIEKEKIEVIRNLYKDKKIEKWFTRKKDALALSTLPESLFQFSEEVLFGIVERIKDDNEPWIKLINELIPYVNFKPIDEKKQDARIEEILGFSLVTVRKLSELLTLAEKYPELNLCSLTSREQDSDLCYWFLLNKATAKTKKGKSYLVLTVTDNSTTVKMKCWDMINFTKGQAYISHVKKDSWGYSLINDDYCCSIDL